MLSLQPSRRRRVRPVAQPATTARASLARLGREEVALASPALFLLARLEPISAFNQAVSCAHATSAAAAAQSGGVH